MKEASGELSMTAITVVAIAGLGVLFTTLIWPNIKSTIERNTNCNQTISCDCKGGNKTCDCKYLDKNGIEQDVKCPASK